MATVMSFPLEVGGSSDAGGYDIYMTVPAVRVLLTVVASVLIIIDI